MANIPDEVIHYEILTRLPIKSLLRFKCVSKCWYALITSSTFLNFRRMHDRDLTIVCKGHRNKKPQNYLYYTHLDYPRSIRTERYVFDKSNYDIAIVASSNGVICYLLWEYELVCLVLCNPLTRERREVLEAPRMDAVYGGWCYFVFGYDFISRDYKIVKISIIYNLNLALELVTQVRVQVYRASTNLWKFVENVPQFFEDYVCYSDRVEMNNKIHWISHRSRNIMTFELHNEELGEMSIPVTLKEHANTSLVLDLVVSGGCLCIAASEGCNVSIWTMKEYGVKTSWFKSYEFVRGEICGANYWVFSYQSTRGGGDNLVVKHDIETDDLVLYDRVDKSIRRVGVTGKRKRGSEWVCSGNVYPIPGGDPSVISSVSSTIRKASKRAS